MTSTTPASGPTVGSLERSDTSADTVDQATCPAATSWPGLRGSESRWAPPKWTQSIKFRLALTYSVTVYAVGSLMIGGLYAYQVNRIDEPTMVYQSGAVMVRRTGQMITFSGVPTLGSLFETVEHETSLAAIENLKQASLVGLMVLVVLAFVIGWVLATVTLRPINRMVSVARDISGSDLSRRIALPGPDDELRGLADTFDDMLDRLQTAFEDQRRFVQDASHELRNPLAVARTNLELALSNPNPTVDELRRSVEVAHRSTGRMSHIVEDLLVQARSGVPQIDLVTLDLVAVAQEVRQQFTGPAAERSIAITIESDGPVPVKGDEQALTRVVLNLVSNALRFAPGHSTVEISVSTCEPWAKLSVTDHGPGLSEEDQQQVFTRFWRGKNAGQGSGLGLSIVKQVVERHGGTVVVCSELGHGATFTIALPLAGLPSDGSRAADYKPGTPADGSIGRNGLSSLGTNEGAER